MRMEKRGNNFERRDWLLGYYKVGSGCPLIVKVMLKKRNLPGSGYCSGIRSCNRGSASRRNYLRSLCSTRNQKHCDVWHDECRRNHCCSGHQPLPSGVARRKCRSEEHTSELQSRGQLV